MSWFCHVNQGSNNHQEPPDMMATTADSLSSSHYSNSRGPTLGATSAPMLWPSCTSPRLSDFPSVPQGSEPPSLENLSCTSLNVVSGGEPAPVSYVTVQEQRSVLSWFLSWNNAQRERFLQDLLGKAVPGKVCTLLESLNTLQVGYISA